MDAFIDLVTIGRAARNANRMKVRQPLALMVVRPRDEAQADAVRTFKAELLSELNVKAVDIRPNVDDLCSPTFKLDFGKAGPHFGKQVQSIASSLTHMSRADVQSGLSRGVVTVDIGGTSLDVPTEMLRTDMNVIDGWFAQEELGTVVLFDGRVTPELAREGVARELIRNLQMLRKDADLQLQARIVVSVVGRGELVTASIAEWRDEIAREVLAVDWLDTPLDAPLASSSVKVGDGEVRLALATDSSLKSSG
jgi:isoleucyl-tRNA synthetase